jgi:hypothetical protein
VSDKIELHDSMVAVEIRPSGVLLRFCPAYVHHWEESSRGWHGEGRTQEAELVIGEASVVGGPRTAVLELAGGSLKVGGQEYSDLIPARLDADAPIHCRLEIMNAEPLVVKGSSVRIRLVGESQFVEELPSEWAPGREAV